MSDFRNTANFSEISSLIDKLSVEGNKAHYDPDRTDQVSLDSMRKEFNEMVYNINRLFDNTQAEFTKRSPNNGYS
jgi:hypothetical protein